MSSLLIRLFIKNPDDLKSTKTRQSFGALGSFVGIICNLLLSLFKIVVGTLSGSISIIADGLNNLSDMGSSIITMIGFRMAGKPADSDHPFGHGRMEYMSAFVVSMLILLVGFELLKSSATSLINGDSMPTYKLVAIIVLAVSITIKFWLYFFNKKIGKTINSDALIATAKDSLNDCITTFAILVSVAVSHFVELSFNLDAIMGVLIAIYILFSGFSSAKGTLDQILGTPPEKELIEDIEKTILSIDGFEGIHDLIIHNYGPGRQFASVHVEVPQNCDIVKCHEQIDLCEKNIYDTLGVSLVIHMDPIDTDNENVAITRHKMAEALTVIDNRLTLHDFRMTPFGDTQTNLIFDVVVPSDVKIPQDELRQKIETCATIINPTFKCVITFDNDFTGRVL